MEQEQCHALSREMRQMVRFDRFKSGRSRRTLQGNRAFFQACLAAAGARALAVDANVAHQRLERVLLHLRVQRAARYSEVAGDAGEVAMLGLERGSDPVSLQLRQTELRTWRRCALLLVGR